MMVTTNEALLDQLKSSQVLSPEELRRAAELIGDHDDSKAAARKLVGAGLLTRWQAGQLLKGKAALSLGKYTLLDRLPWGSSHAVFLAKHPTMDRKVALNVLDKTSSARSDAVKSFLADARAVAALDHRNLIHVYDIDEADDRYFLVMEHVEGRNLHDVVKAGGPLSLEAGADIVRQIADGLGHAHRAKLIHGGLRPTNVLLDGQGIVKIIDLGVSKFDDPTKQPENGSSNSQVLEIASFLSPEQASDGAATAQSDLYSLGCIGYMLLAGKPPFGEGDYAQRLASHPSDTPPDVRKLRAEVPTGFAEILSKLISKVPGERYAAAGEVVAAIERWWNEYSAQLEAAKPKPKPKPAAKPPVKSGPVAAAKPAPSARPEAKPAPVPAAKPAASKQPPAVSSFPTLDASTTSARTPFPAINIGGKQPTNRNPISQTDPRNLSSSEARAKKASQETPLPGPNQKPIPSRPGRVPMKPPALPSKVVEPQMESLRSADGQRPAASVLGVAASSPNHAKLSPLLLAAIGGGVLLLLLLVGGGLAAYFFLLSDEKPDPAVVAVTSGDDESKQGDDTSGSESSTGDDDKEEEPPGEDKPAEEGEKPAVDPPADEPEDPPAQEPKDPAPPVDPPPADPPKEEPKDPAPPKEVPKPEPPKVKPPDPFVDLASAVSLPAVKEERKAAVALGPVSIPADGTCYIDLVGGDKATPKEGVGFSMEPARGGLAERDWEIKLTGLPRGETVVAHLALTDKELTFQWMPDATQLDEAGYLANCQFNLRTADHEKYVTLRQPQETTSIPVDLARAQHREKFDIPFAANPETIMVEVIKVEGIEKSAIEPKQQLVAKQDTTFVWFGEGDDRILGLKFDVMMQKDLQIAVTPVVNDPVAGPTKLVAKKLAAAKAQVVAASAQLNARLQALNASAQKAQLANQIAQTQQQLDTAMKALDTFDKLEKQAEAVQGAASVQFRVFYTDGDHQVDLVRGMNAPPVAEAGAKRNE